MYNMGNVDHGAIPMLTVLFTGLEVTRISLGAKGHTIYVSAAR